MKKFLLVLSAFLLVLGISSFAGAVVIPFQIDGSDLTVTWDWGGGIVNYSDYSSGVYNLDEGDYFDFTFGKIFVPLALGEGEAEFAVNFSLPDPAVTPSGTGDFSVFSFWIFTVGSIEFGDPETFSYSYMGTPGGLLELAFNDLSGIKCGTWIDITGRVTNVTSPVPEPSTMLLLGFGLLGLAGFGRKKFLKK